MKKQYLNLIQETIGKYISPDQHKVFIFGSRASKTNNKFSDIDIGIEGPKLDGKTYYAILDELENSDLPFLVDLVEFNNVSDKFQAIAKQNIVPLNF